MKTLYFECNMGAAGDMIMASLLELHPKPSEFIEKLNSLNIPGVIITPYPSTKCGITGTHIEVKVNNIEENEDMHSHSHHDHHHSHDHNNMHSITHLIEDLNVSQNVKDNALCIYNLIAEAESHVHGVPVTEIHFHEVGTMDAVADIVGTCMLIEELSPELILSSPINVGSGQVKCAHGILPVPAPATTYILRDVPIYSNEINGELCTPTGAAILKHFVKKFEKMPVMNVLSIGYGMGKKDFESANCIRTLYGNIQNEASEVCELICNIDDMTPESLAFTQQLLLDEGALDVYTIPIGMKKNRIGILLTCMCNTQMRDKMLSLIFKNTTTLGIRENISKRYTLKRKFQEIQTKYGPVRIKVSSGYGIEKSKIEYEDIAKIAKETNLSLTDIIKEINY